MGLPTLSAHQEDAVKAAVQWQRDHEQQVFYLGGYAGTGKSTILPVCIDAMGIHPDDIQFVAPTAKAAKVMSSKLRDFGIEKRARTIHSLIYRPKPLRAEVLQKQLDDTKATYERHLEGLHEDGDSDWAQHPQTIELKKSMELLEKDLDKAFDRSEGPNFQLNVDSEARNAKLIVVDEASMVGDLIAGDLFGFDIPIFAMGDPGQLPPVGDKPGITHNKPDFFLTEIHRQARDNPIIRLATMAREQQSIKFGNYGDGVDVIQRIKDDATYNMDREAQIIVGTHKRRWMVTKKLRKALGFETTGPCAGEPLMICKNSKKFPDLVNGTTVNCLTDVGNLRERNVAIGLNIEDELGNKLNILAVQGLFEEHTLQQRGASTAPKNLAFRAKIESEHVDWAWAITCHKAQGSQWDDVILHDESGAFRDDWHLWLYTGITRAAKRLTIVV